MLNGRGQGSTTSRGGQSFESEKAGGREDEAGRVGEKPHFAVARRGKRGPPLRGPPAGICNAGLAWGISQKWDLGVIDGRFIGRAGHPTIRRYVLVGIRPAAQAGGPPRRFQPASKTAASRRGVEKLAEGFRPSKRKYPQVPGLRQARNPVRTWQRIRRSPKSFGTPGR